MEESVQGEVATFAAGCFWDVEAMFRRREGVVATRVGYTGGLTPEPTYEQVSSGSTGHVEAIQVIFDPARISYGDILDLFWSIPETPQEQDASIRPVIFYHSPEQKAAAEASRDAHDGRNSIAVEILPAGKFWPAEESHQRYYEKCGQSYGTSQKFWD